MSGTRRCRRECMTCPHILEGTLAEILNDPGCCHRSPCGDCGTSGVVYFLYCRRHNTGYVGRTKNELGYRFDDHRRDAENLDFSKVVARHWHDHVNELKVTILKKCDERQLPYAERKMICYMSTTYKSMNLLNIQSRSNCPENIRGACNTRYEKYTIDYESNECWKVTTKYYKKRKRYDASSSSDSYDCEDSEFDTSSSSDSSDSSSSSSSKSDTSTDSSSDSEAGQGYRARKKKKRRKTK